ncbi:MAG: outer membrane protein transport protein [Muribaculaceae bacterium]|nr:outer membrane protein transport protein [Muribaculaceae bacterium]
MRKIFIAVAALTAVLGLRAEGYQVNTLSTRQTGMGHVGTAMKLGAESQLFNPGALAFSDNTFELTGSVAAISAHATATHHGVDYKTDNDLSTPFSVTSSWRILDRFYGGVAFYTPYGSSINWGEHWPGAVLNQKVGIRMFTVQPTLSYRILPNLSVGAGLMLSWGSVDLYKGLLAGESLNRLMGAVGMPPEAMYAPGTTPASVNLKGSTGLAVGYSVGAMWDISKRWTVGVSYRSKTTMTVAKGDASVSYSGAAEAMLSPVLDNLNHTNFKASLPAPYVLTAGVSFKPLENVIVAFDLQLNGWGTYKYLDIEFAGLSAFDQHLEKNYHNSLTYHLGAQWGVTKRLDLRAGLMIDCSPCDANFYNPETPGQTRIEPSVGLSFRPVKNLSIDFAFMYVQGCGLKNGTGHYEDLVYKIAAQQNPALPGMLDLSPTGTFTADYKVHAFIPSLGLSYSF